jgi:predicted phage terminase large subunit-like protein
MAAKKTTPKKANNPLDKLLSEYAAKHLSVQTTDLSKLDLLEFLVTASPHLRSPEHLSAVLPYLYAVEHSQQFFCFSAPPRHGKSVLINHFAAWMMLRHPGIRIAYGSYGLDLSHYFSTEVKDILTSNGVEVDRSMNTKGEWRLMNRSSFLAVAPGSGFTGRGADLIIVDDPYKSRLAAESGKQREEVLSWFRSVAITRRSPNCSVIVTHTRWSAEDLIGVLVRDQKKPFVNLEALDPETGEALWPSQYSSEALAATRAEIGEYDWAALYMGSPRPRGGSVFNEPTTYSKEDFEDAKITKYVIGIDCAYTKKLHADYSVAVVLAITQDKKAYVVDVRRMQVEAPNFAEVLKQLRMTYDGATIHWYVGGQEKVVADFFMNSCGVPVKVTPAKEDKFARAQAVAAAWNAGRVLLPEESKPWMNAFLGEVLSFTGMDDPHDDCPDALAAAWIPQARPRVPRGMVQDLIF